MKKKLFVLLMALALLGVSLSGCSSKDSDAPTLRIIDSRISEGKIVIRAAMLLLEDRTDVNVELKDEMTAPNSFQELIADNADMFMSYDGTVLTTLLHIDPSEVPEGSTVYDYANEQVQEQNGCELLDKLGLNNTYVMAVTAEVQETYNLQNTSDLAAVSSNIVFGAEHEFFDEEGSAKYGPYVEAYCFQFKDAISVDLDLKYPAMQSGNFEATVVYAPDGLNTQADLRLLEDDLHFFPEYNGALLVRSDLFDKFAETCPELRDVLNELGGIFSDETMSELTYRVDVNGESVDDVAESYLREIGLLTD